MRRRRVVLVVLLVAALALAALWPAAEPVAGPRPPDEALAPTGEVAASGSLEAGGDRASVSSGATSVASSGAAPAEPGTGTLDVLVFDRVTRQPVPAEVTVSGSWGERRVETDADGRARLVLAAGAVTIQARAGVLASARSTESILPGQFGAVLLDLAPEDCRVAGVVVDRDGRPIPGATVRLEGRTTAADAAGRFGFDALREEQVEVGAGAPGFLWRWVQLVPEPSPGEARIELDREVRLRCEVRLPDGAPAAGAALLAWARSARDVRQDGPPTISRWCGDDGRVELDGLPGGGALTVWATLDTGTSVELRATPSLTLHPTDPAPLVIVLGPPATLRGRLVRPGGRSLDGLRVRVGEDDVVDLEADGSFANDALTAGRVALSVSSDGTPASPTLCEVELRAGDVTTVDLVVEGVCEVSGAVRHEGTWTSLPRVELARDGVRMGEVQVESDGRFVLPALPPGRWCLRATSAGLSSPPLERLLEPDGLVEGLELVLEPAARLDVRVVDDAGEPLYRARVTRTGRSGAHEEWTDPAGRASFEGLSAGPLELRVDDEEALARVARRRRVAAARCEPVSVELRAGETRELLLRVVDAGGR